LEGLEILRRGERHERPAARERGIRDDPALLLLEIRDPRILDAPDLLAVRLRRRQQRRLRIDSPSAEAVGAARYGEVRESATILDAEQQNGLAVDDRGGGIEDAVRPVIEVVDGQYRVVGVAPEDFVRVGRPRAAHFLRLGLRAGSHSFPSDSVVTMPTRGAPDNAPPHPAAARARER